MLDCANNFANKYDGKLCKRCGVVHDENHRINECIVYEFINLGNCDTKITFGDIHEQSDEKVMVVVERILERGNNEIRAPATV